MVSAFLSHHFSEVTDYSFTADMETELDNVSAGLTEWEGLLRDYWTRFKSYCECTTNVHIHQVEKMLEKKFEPYLFSSLPDHSRLCPRFSSYLYTIDDSLPFIMNILLANFVGLLGIAIVLSYVQVFFLVLLLPFWYIYSRVQDGQTMPTVSSHANNEERNTI